MNGEDGRAVVPVLLGIFYGCALSLLALFLFGGGGHGALLLPLALLSSPVSAVIPAFPLASFFQWGFFGYLVTTGKRGRRWGIFLLVAHNVGLPLSFFWAVRTDQGAADLAGFVSQWSDVRGDVMRVSVLYLFGQAVAWLAVLRPPSHWDSRPRSPVAARVVPNDRPKNLRRRGF